MKCRGKYISHELIYRHIRADRSEELAAHCRPDRTTEVRNIPGRVSTMNARRKLTASDSKTGRWILSWAGTAKELSLLFTERNTNMMLMERLSQGKHPEYPDKVLSDSCSLADIRSAPLPRTRVRILLASADFKNFGAKRQTGRQFCVFCRFILFMAKGSYRERKQAYPIVYLQRNNFSNLSDAFIAKSSIKSTEGHEKNSISTLLKMFSSDKSLFFALDS